MTTNYYGRNSVKIVENSNIVLGRDAIKHGDAFGKSVNSWMEQDIQRKI
jgi:hypothetical protein